MHGTRSCYVRGCREPECVQANRDYQRAYWHRDPVLPTINQLALSLIREVRRNLQGATNMAEVLWMSLPVTPEARVTDAQYVMERILDGKTYASIGQAHGVSKNRAIERVQRGAPVVYLCVRAVKRGLQ